MQVLPKEILTPVSSGIQDPLHSMLGAFEAILASHPAYQRDVWPEVKKGLIYSALQLKNCGSFLNGAVQTAPNLELATALDEMKQLISYSAYFTSQYWRAFYYWLDKGKFNPRWPQFSQREVSATLTSLEEKDLDKIKEIATKSWPDFFADTQGVNDLFSKLQRNIKNLCFKKLHFLSVYDCALYSKEDLHQEINLRTLQRLRQSDYFEDDPIKMIRWATKCADNCIKQLREYALADKRCRIDRVAEADAEGNTKHHTTLRETALSSLLGEDFVTLEDAVRFLAVKGPSTQDEGAIYDSTCLRQLQNLGNPRMNVYLDILWGENHNIEFWHWFQREYPNLAKKSLFIEERPEAIGPWVQRWLGLTDTDIITFFRNHLPTLLDRSDRGRRKRLASF